MGRLAVRESVMLAGRAERARAARAFVGEVLGPGHPCGDGAVLLAGEIFASSIRLGCSGGDGRGHYRERSRPDRGHRPSRVTYQPRVGWLMSFACALLSFCAK